MQPVTDVSRYAGIGSEPKPAPVRGAIRPPASRLPAPRGAARIAAPRSDAPRQVSPPAAVPRIGPRGSR